MRNVKCAYCGKGLRRQLNITCAACDDCKRKNYSLKTMEWQRNNREKVNESQKRRLDKERKRKMKANIEALQFNCEDGLCERCGQDIEDLREYVHLGMTTIPQKSISYILRARVLSYLFLVYEKRIPINRSFFFERNSLMKAGVIKIHTQSKTVNKVINHYVPLLGYSKQCMSYNSKHFDIEAALDFGLKEVETYCALGRKDQEWLREETKRLLGRCKNRYNNAFAAMGAALYQAAKINYRENYKEELQITQREIANGFGITEVTIRNYLNEYGAFE